METPLRSLSKTLSWRFLAMFITAGIGYALTRKWQVALTLGTSDTLIKLFFYYLHERAWNRLPYGRAEGLSPEALQPEVVR